MTTVIDHDKVIIFSYPRAGTKLIASILESNGYHNHGEWYDTWTCEVDTKTQTSRRLTQDEIKTNYQNIDASERNYIHTKKIIERRTLLDDTFKRSTITMWWENISMFPFLVDLHRDRLWILPKRNTWDQLLSWYIVFVNKNPNGDVPSMPIRVDQFEFERLFWKLMNVNTLQDWILNNRDSVTLDFDQLTQGNSIEFGFDYQVDSDDQHSSLEPFILNIRQVTEWFNNLTERHNQLC
jgi:hypothetical protein